MAELEKAVGVNVPLVESLVKAHFGPEVTAKLSWSITKGRYVRSELPRRLARPQKILGIRLWWQTIGEFTDNIGFRLELWRPEYRRQAKAFVEEYNARTQGTKLELCLGLSASPGTARPAAA